MNYELCKKLKDRKGKNNPRWKGREAGYHSKHLFLVRNFGNPSICSMCHIKGKKEKDSRWSIQWALKHDKDYTHDKDDYMPLCRSCHGKYDWNENKTKQMIEAAKKQKGTKSMAKSLIALNRKRDEYGHFIKTKA